MLEWTALVSERQVPCLKLLSLKGLWKVAVALSGGATGAMERLLVPVTLALWKRENEVNCQSATSQRSIQELVWIRRRVQRNDRPVVRRLAAVVVLLETCAAIAMVVGGWRVDMQVKAIWAICKTLTLTAVTLSGRAGKQSRFLQRRAVVPLECRCMRGLSCMRMGRPAMVDQL